MEAKRAFTFQHTHQELYCAPYVYGNYEGEQHQIGMRDLFVPHKWAVPTDDTLPPDPRPFDQYNVGGGHLEELVVYLGLSWRMVQEQQLDCYAIPCYSRDKVAALLKKPFDFVAWEYDVRAEDPHNVEDKGFVPARSAIPLHPAPSRWQLQHQHQADLFHIETFAELVALQKATFADATSEITLFGVPPHRKSALVAFLNSPAVPHLAQFLAPEAVFIDLVIDIDLFACDALLIKTVGDTTQYIDTLAQEYEQAIAHFEARVKSIQDMETYLHLLSHLAQAHFA